MRIRPLLLIALIGLAISTAPASRAAQVVWSGLVMAENVPQPAAAPSELTALEPTLKALFGYNQFQVIGQSRKTLKTGEEDWLAASKYFSLHVDAQGETEAGYVLGLRLYKEKDVLLETQTKLSKESPLVIKGPQIGGGQLLLVLVVDGEEHKAHAGESHKHANEQSNGLITAFRRLGRYIRSKTP